MSAGQNISSGTPDRSPGPRRVKRGLVAIDGGKLSQARHKRGLTQEEFAEEVGIDLRALQRYEAGGNAEKSAADKIAKVLGLETLIELMPDGPPLPQATPKPPAPGRERMVIVFHIDSNKVAPENQPKLAASVVGELAKDELVKNRACLVKVTMCKVQMVLEVDKEDADRVMEAFRRGELSYLDVASITLPDRGRLGRHLAALFSLLGLLCALLALVPAVRLPACACGILWGGIGLFFGFRRKKGWILPMITAILNAGILVFALLDGTFFESRQAAGNGPQGDNGGHVLPKPEDTRRAAVDDTGKGGKPQGETSAKANPKDGKDDAVKEAVKKVKDADLKYSDAPVEIKMEVVTSIVKWGDASKLTKQDFKTSAKKVTANQTGLPGEVNCGTETNFMGNISGYSVFAAKEGSQGLAVKEKKNRLVVFIPFDGDGFGTPMIVTGEEDSSDYRYHTPKDAQTSGYFLVKQGGK